MTVNVILQLADQLAGRLCRPATANIAIVIPNGNRRRSDVHVECGPFADDSFEADQPALAVEIISPFETRFDRFRKIEDLKMVSALRYILLIDTEAPNALLHSRREAESWISGFFRGLDAIIDLPNINVVLRLADLYRGLTFKSSAVR